MLSLFPISVEFPLTPLDEVEGVTLICLRKWKSMDVVRLIVNTKPDEINPYVAAGSPLRIKWYADGLEDEFIGYIHSLRPSSEGYSQKTVILGVSAAYPLFNETGRTFQGTAIHNIAEEICQDHSFQLEMDMHPMLQEQVLQQDESDWSLLQRLGEKWGYVLLFDGVTMVYRQMDGLLEDNYRQATVEHTDPILTERASRLISFEPSFSAIGKTPSAKTRGEGVDPIGVGRIPWVQPGKDAMFQDIATTQSVVSELEGELVGVGFGAKTKYPYTAKALIQTPVAAKPLDVYQIIHEGSRMTWVIQSVKHIITGEDYIGEVLFMSDGEDHVSDVKGKRLDVSTMIRMNRARRRTQPTIVNSRPYLVGSASSVLVKDQRWKALVTDKISKTTEV